MVNPVPAATLQTAASIPQTQPAATESEGPQTLHLLVGRSLVISSPSKIKRVSLADPTIAEAIVVSPFQVLLNGKAPGVFRCCCGMKQIKARRLRSRWTLTSWD